MPRYDLDRDAFVRSIERRRRWAHRSYWARSQIRRPALPLQAAVYDAAFRSDAEAVSYHYAAVNDHMPDLEAPSWVNEKVRWQFLNHPNPLMSLAADKIAVRDYLRLKRAEVAPPALIATGSDPRALASAELPARFALKSAYGSGQNHIEAGPMRSDPAELMAKVARWRDFDQWRHTGELHYRAIPKRWLVEEFVPSDRERLEFKFFCLQGEPVFVSVITGRSAKGARRAVYDLAWNRLELQNPGTEPEPRPVPRPLDLDRMIAEARRLSEDFLHVRVDFLKFDGMLYFSELTFANLAARQPFMPLEANRELGAMIDLGAAADYLARGRRIAYDLGWSAAA